MRVESIPTSECVQWILKKHYAHRLPSISFAFGLFDDRENVGICTFGQSANYIESEAWKPIQVYELNRLVVKDGLPKNSLSFFVSSCLKKLPPPLVIISYADLRQGHHGYIYQATNWIYTGVGGEGQKIYVMKDGTERHQRHAENIPSELIDHIEETTGKARYYYFLGNKKDKKEMKKRLRFPVLKYPKGENKKYDTSYQIPTQGVLF